MKTEDRFDANDPRCASCHDSTEIRNGVPIGSDEYRELLKRHHLLQSPCPLNCSRRLTHVFGGFKLLALMRGTYVPPDPSGLTAVNSDVGAFHSHKD